MFHNRERKLGSEEETGILDKDLSHNPKREKRETY